MKKKKLRCTVCNKKTKNPAGVCSACAALEAADKKRGSKMSKLYFWLFVTLAIMAVFLIWSAKGSAVFNEKKKINTNYLAAIIAIMLSLMFGLFCFVRFIRNRSLTGGIFLTVSISTVIFLGASQVIDTIIPPTAAAFAGGGNPEAVDAGYTAIIGLAQIGLFALWFLFLLFTIYTQVSPVRKIDKVLGKIIDGNDVRRVKLGKSRQYRCISEKLETISADARKRHEQEAQRKERLAQQRARAAERRKAMASQQSENIATQ